MKCIYHPDEDAVDVCSNCGRPICAECERTLSVGGCCPQCAEECSGGEVVPPSAVDSASISSEASQEGTSRVDGGSTPEAPPAYRKAPKEKVAAGLLGLFLGWAGAHKFYLGYNAEGVVMLCVTLLGGLGTFGIGAFVMFAIGFAEGIIYLTKSDEEFQRTYVERRRCWF